MRILHKEGYNITIWVFSDEGLPLYPVIVQSDVLTEIADRPSVQADGGEAVHTTSDYCDCKPAAANANCSNSLTNRKTS